MADGFGGLTYATGCRTPTRQRPETWPPHPISSPPLWSGSNPLYMSSPPWLMVPVGHDPDLHASLHASSNRGSFRPLCPSLQAAGLEDGPQVPCRRSPPWVLSRRSLDRPPGPLPGSASEGRSPGLAGRRSRRTPTPRSSTCPPWVSSRRSPGRPPGPLPQVPFPRPLGPPAPGLLGARRPRVRAARPVAGAAGPRRSAARRAPAAGAGTGRGRRRGGRRARAGADWRAGGRGRGRRGTCGSMSPTA